MKFLKRHLRKACGTASIREEQMTSDASRSVRLGIVAQRSAVKTATREYCQVVREVYDPSLRYFVFHRATGRLGRARP